MKNTERGQEPQDPKPTRRRRVLLRLVSLDPKTVQGAGEVVVIIVRIVTSVGGG